VNARTQAYYAALAPHYDGLPHHRSAPVRTVARALGRALRLEAEDLLVDLCCGTGLFAREIRRQRPLRYQIVAVDASPAMLERLRAHWDPGIRPVAMDAAAFSAFPVRYDKILVKDAVSEIPDPAGLFGLLRERLAPGGRLVVVETAPDSRTALFKEAYRRWEALAPRAEELAHLVEAAGFRVRRSSLRVRQRLAKRDVLEMVESRYAPILATFEDAELDAGIGELRERFAAVDWVDVPHRFDLVIGAG
jgi:SAM-dependent methyltransferase